MGCRKTDSHPGQKKTATAARTTGECASNACPREKCVGSMPRKRSREVRLLGLVGPEAVAVSFDYALLGSGQEVCRIRSDTTPLNGEGYYCTNPSGGRRGAGHRLSESAGLDALRGEKHPTEHARSRERWLGAREFSARRDARLCPGEELPRRRARGHRVRHLQRFGRGERGQDVPIQSHPRRVSRDGSSATTRSTAPASSRTRRSGSASRRGTRKCRAA